jgi:hypothetical protein
VTGNREERVGVEVSNSRRWGLEGKAKKADTLNWIMGKKEVTESETDEGVRNIRIKSDQRQTGHDQNSLFAGGNQKGRRGE